MRIIISGPSDIAQQVRSDCQHWLGCSAWKQVNVDLGCFLGSGIIMPERFRVRRIVVGATVKLCWCFECQAIQCPETEQQSEKPAVVWGFASVTRSMRPGQ